MTKTKTSVMCTLVHCNNLYGFTFNLNNAYKEFQRPCICRLIKFNEKL